MMKFGILGNIAKKELKSVLDELFGFLNEKNIDFIFDERFLSLLNFKSSDSLKAASIENTIINSDIIIAIGGDGTILSAARKVYNYSKPIIGVNLGKLGFLAEIDRSEIFSFINDVLNDNFEVENRNVLIAEIKDYHGETLLGLNDIVIEKSNSSRLISVEANLNNEYLFKLLADGLIVSTATGSTAYSLACNGPIVVPSSKVIILNPISPHTLTARPIVFPENFILKVNVKSENKKVLISSDGQNEVILTTPVEIIVKKAELSIKLLRRKDISYFDILRSKLMWGKDTRIDKIS